MFTASAPGKLMLLGEHAVVYGQPCLVTAVGQRMRATVTALTEPVLEVEAPEMQIAGYRKDLVALGTGSIPKGVAFVENAVKNLLASHPFKGGLRVETASEFSSQFGFGSSSASTVCTLRAASEMLGLRLTNRQIFEAAYKTVLDVQKKGSGFDVAAAVFGGTLLYQNGGEVIEAIDVPDLPLVVGYSGIKADTVTLMGQVKALADEKPDLVSGIYERMGELVWSGKDALSRKDWSAFGAYMNECQGLLKKLGVSIERLDQMIRKSLKAGALGAKLSGAGGGDCMIALVDEELRWRVQEGILEAAGHVIDVSVHAEGVRIES